MSAYRFSALALEQAVAERFRTGHVSRVLNVSGSTWAHFRRVGLSPFQADRLACRIGLHPSAVWPEWAVVNAEHLEEAK